MGHVRNQRCGEHSDVQCYLWARFGTNDVNDIQCHLWARFGSNAVTYIQCHLWAIFGTNAVWCRQNCLFLGRVEKFVWLYLPILIMLLLNTAMFLYVAYAVCRLLIQHSLTLITAVVGVYDPIFGNKVTLLAGKILYSILSQIFYPSFFIVQFLTFKSH